MPTPIAIGSRSPTSSAADFLVRDNGVEQVVDSLGTTDSAHVIIGLDLSGSVDGKTLDQLREAVRALVGALTPDDRVSLFTFSDRLRLLLRATPPGGDLDAMLARFEASGATPLHDALVFGGALSHADRRPSVFLLFTDGQDTTSWTSAARALEVAAPHQRGGVPGRGRAARRPSRRRRWPTRSHARPGLRRRSATDSGCCSLRRK